jgi:hypothetical protein
MKELFVFKKDVSSAVATALAEAQLKMISLWDEVVVLQKDLNKRRNR